MGHLGGSWGGGDHPPAGPGAHGRAEPAGQQAAPGGHHRQVGWHRPGLHRSSRLSRRQFLGSVGALGVAAAGTGYLARPVEGSTRGVAAVPSPAAEGPLRLVGATEAPNEVVLTFSSALRALPAAAVAPVVTGVNQPSPTQVAIPRDLTSYRGTLDVVGTDGDHLRLPVQVPALARAPIHYFADDTGGRVYLTIDDGWSPNMAVLAAVREQRVPITTFLIQQAAVANPGFWRAFAGAGGLIMNHTYSHPDLTTLSVAQVDSQWGRPAGVYPTWYGQIPTIGRTPYGAVDPRVAVEASRAGMEALVMWGAIVEGALQTWNGGPLQAGDIILLHWVPGVARDLAEALAAIKSRGLTPAALTPDVLVHPNVPLSAR
ncbi:MAG TPA: polysaccharide deacetylase family protein [Acidimicrobiales bacterium]|nr:polysaccharide deacetylase family protein [Acidimicrobiales bacterium]